MVSVGEQILSVDRPLNLLGLEGFNEHVGGRSDQGDIVINTIEVVNQVVFGLVGHVGIPIHEVSTPGDHEVVAQVVGALVDDEVVQTCTLDVRVEGAIARITDHGVFVSIVALVVPVSVWPLIRDLHRMREDFD